VPETAPKATYSRDEVRRLLSVTERQLKDWERHSLIQPAEHFAIPDLIALRTLVKLRQDRIPPKKIRAAVSAIRERLNDIQDPLRELKVIADGKRIRVEIAGQYIEPVSGQLLFNFDTTELKRLLAFPGQTRKTEEDRRSRRESAEKWFQRGLQLEQTGSMKEAVDAYEQAVATDAGSAGAWVNLGTIYFNARQFGRAEQYYRKALEADADYPLAHFNMANLFDERRDYLRARDHYETAVRLNPSYADAHYNLALLHQSCGRMMDAVRHWKIYLKLDPGSSWGAIARRELEKLRKAAVVPPSRQRQTGTTPRRD
jgi:Tfp pilus assembly protein PilF